MKAFIKKYFYGALEYIPEPLQKLLGLGFHREAGFQRYFFNTSWMFFGQFASMAASFFVGAYVARYLGPKNYGLMNFVISFSGLFAFLAGFGIDAILNRELIKRPELKEKLIGSGFWIKFAGGFLVVLVTNIAALTVRDEPFLRLLIFLFSLTFVIQAFGVIALYFQSQVMAQKNITAQLAVLGMSIVLKLTTIHFHKGVAWFIGIFIFEAIANAVIVGSFYFKQNHTIDWRFSWPIAKSLLKDAMPLMFITVAMTIYLKIDQTLLKFLMNETAVGIYAVAVKLCEIWYFIPNIISASLFPALVNARKTDEQSYFRRLGSLYRLMLVLAIGVAIPVFVLAGFIVKFLFGPAYESAVLPLRIYIWSGIPIFLMAAITQYLIAENFTRIYLLGSMLGAAVNIILNLLLIPKYGIVGSALATLFAYWVPVITTFFYSQTRRQWGLIISNTYVTRNL